MRDTLNQPYAASPRALFASLWHNRELIVQLTRREVLSRYRGSILGLAWSFFNPLLMLVVYTFVFSVVFKARWGLGEESKADFAIVLFVGLIIHGLFAECVNRSEEHTSELQSPCNLVCRLLLEKKNKKNNANHKTTNKKRKIKKNE